jgi:hypothetical protein
MPPTRPTAAQRRLRALGIPDDPAGLTTRRDPFVRVHMKAQRQQQRGDYGVPQRRRQAPTIHIEGGGEALLETAWSQGAVSHLLLRDVCVLAAYEQAEAQARLNACEALYATSERLRGCTADHAPGAEPAADGQEAS